MSLVRGDLRPRCDEPGVKNGDRKMRHEEMRFLTIAEVAQRLSVSTRSIRRWIADGYLIAHHFGTAVRIAESELATFITQHRIA